MQRLLKNSSFQAALLAVAALLVYMRTLAPTITFGDSPELATAAYQLGVPHPTGYPLYMLLGHAFIRIFPFGDPAYRMNLLSALFGAAAVGLLYLLGLKIIRNRAASAAAALLFAFSLTFWSQAIVTEVYTLHVVLVTAILLTLVTWDRKSKIENRKSKIALASLLFGLAMTHHVSAALILPAAIYYILTSPRRAEFLRRLPLLLPLALLPLLLYLYLPWAANRNPAMNWGDPNTWERFVDHVSGSQYQFKMGVHSAGQLWKNVVRYAGTPVEDVNPGYLQSDFPLAVLWLAPLGLWTLLRRRSSCVRRLFWTTLLLYASVTAWALNYQIADLEAYYLVPHMVLALWIGAGLRVLIVAARRLWRKHAPSMLARKVARKGLGAAPLLFALLLLGGNWLANDRSRYRAALVLGEAILGFAKPNAILIASRDDFAFPPLYPRYVKGVRGDVTILFLQDLLIKNHLPLVRRLEKEGIAVNPPPGYGARPPGLIWEYSFVRAFLRDNFGRRPIYFLGLTPDRVAGLKGKNNMFEAHQVPYLTAPMVLVESVEGKPAPQ